MTYSIKHTPIRAESGLLYQWKYNGIASGFQQTQLLDSMSNHIMAMTILSACGINIEAPGFLMKVQGDDGIAAFGEFAYPDETTFLDRLALEAKSRFNATLSPEKTTIGTSANDVEVLSYKNTNGIAYRSESELLAHLLYPERDRGPAELAASAIGIAFAAMGCSRTVYNVCEDVHHFLTTQLNVTPNFREWKWLERTGISMPFDTISMTGSFPSFEETFAQNFISDGRSDKMKQLLWPTNPTGDYGFHFLLD